MHRHVDLERVAERDLRVGHARVARELVVDELRGGHRRRRLERVGGAQVVVLAGVDDDAEVAVDHARDALVDQPAHDVDVAVEDPVEGVVDHVVEALPRAHRGDLRHAQPRAEARQAHVAAVLLGPLVHRLAHDPEVRLGGEGAAVALGRRAVGDVVEQALRGRADHRDDVAAGLRDRLGVDDVLVDVAGRRQHVAQRRGRVAEALAHRPALLEAAGDLRQARRALLADALADRPLLGRLELRQVELAGADRLGDLLGRAAASGASRCRASRRPRGRARRARARGRRARSAAAPPARRRRPRPSRRVTLRSTDTVVRAGDLLGDVARRSAWPPGGRRRPRPGRGRACELCARALIAGPSRSGTGSPRAACRVR